jgi:RHS repeat-associated protein
MALFRVVTAVRVWHRASRQSGAEHRRRLARAAGAVGIFMLIAIGSTAAASANALHASRGTPRVSGSLATLVYAFGDGQGYHVEVGRTDSDGAVAWQRVATLRPLGLDDRSWAGYQCTSGDGRYEAVAVLPISQVDTPALRDHGAFAYDVDLETGAVRAVARGVGLKYHTPGCGTGDIAAFTSNPGSNENSTQVLTVNLRSGEVGPRRTVATQVTSVVPDDGRLVGAVGSHIAVIEPGSSRNAQLRMLANLGGVPYELRPVPGGGVDFLTAVPGATSTHVWQERANRFVQLGTSPLVGTDLLYGQGGEPVVTSPVPLASRAGMRSVRSPSGLTILAVGRGGRTMLAASAETSVPRPEVLRSAGGLLRQVPASNRVAPSTQVIGASTDTRSLVPSARAAGGRRSDVRDAVVAHAAAAQTPVCAVPRNDPTRQALQPNSSQVDWATQMAEQGLLTGSLARPANFDDMGLASYGASSDFAPIALDHPAGDSWNSVPRSVMEAIMAQESNWDQASWHALPGIGGNPLVADYYGAAGTIDTINYAAADCGYGIAQVTDGMALGDTDYSAHGQAKIAVDYEENIAAGLEILESTWNQLYQAGIIANNGDPRYLENWYFAAWAYNTGIEPNAAHGNTTGCTPSPNCTGPDGTWGLGWANNPANPDYPPNRAPYLKTSYADAAHPSNWPYQERILGWMASPLLNLNGSPSYAPPTYHGGSTWLNEPPLAALCATAQNACTPPAKAGQSGTCTLADDDCWWHAPLTWVNCATSCATSSYTVGAGSTEPASSDPHPPTCSVNSSDLPTTSSGAPIIVDDEATDLNVVGCSSPNWTNAGSFTYSYGTDASGDPVGAIDTHQLGAGFGGRILFTHGESGAEADLINTGTWSPTLPKVQYYTIKVHIPATGAAVTDAKYTINTNGYGGPWIVRVNQHLNREAWVTLGTFALAPGSSVVLTNQSSMTPGAYDIAFDAIAFLPQGGSPGVPLGGPPGLLDAPGGSNAAWEQCLCATGEAADPVDTATGNFNESFTDLQTPGRGIPLAFTRTYNSELADPTGPNASNAINGPFGWGWTFSYGLSAQTNATTGDVTLAQEDGSHVTFIPTGSGGYLPAAPRDDATLAVTGSTYVYTRRAKEVLTFDTASGHLLSETDLAGLHASPAYATTLAYNSSGQLTTITDPSGRVYTLAWSGGHIASLTDSAGRTVSYGYDPAGDLTDVYGVGTTRTPTLQNNDHMVMTYQATTHLMATLRQPDFYGNTTLSPSPVVSMTYDSSDRVLTQTDQVGHATTFTYGPNSALSLAAGQTLVTDPSGHERLDTYQSGLLTAETRGYGTSAAGTWTYTYDPVSLGVTSVTDPDGHVDRYTYDVHGNKTSTTDALGYTTSYSYDALDDLTAKVDPLGIQTAYTYDGAGHVAQAGGGTNNGTLSYGLLTSTTTQPLDQTAEPTSPQPTATSRTSQLYYDDPAHPADVSRSVDPDGNTTTYTYDAVGDRASTTDPMGDKTLYRWDTTRGWLTTVVSPRGTAAGTTTTCIPPALGCTTFGHDAWGDQTASTNPLGYQATAVFDADGNKLSTTDANGQKTTLSYDAADRLVKTTQPNGTFSTTAYNPDGTVSATTNGAGKVTSLSYDAQGRMTSKTDPDGHVTRYALDAAGDLVTLTNPAGQTSTYSYDADNEPTAVKYSTASTPSVSALTYNADGQRVSMTDGTGTTTWAYDPFGDATSITNGYGTAVSFSYDPDGNETAIAYPGGASTTVTRAFDKADRLTSVRDWNNATTTFTYNADGEIATTQYPGATVADAYDNADGLQSTTLSTSSTTLASLAYTRDHAGQVLTSTPTGIAGAVTQTYGYTPLEQLATVTTGTQTSNLAYDTANDPTATGAATATYDPSSELCWTITTTIPTATCGSPPAGATKYTYNTDGDRTGTIPATGTASTYTYNQLDELTTALGPAGTATYSYDGAGQRVSKTVAGMTTHFIYDDAGPNLLSDGTADYVYGPGGLPIEQIGTAGAAWYVHDQLGSTIALVNSAGTVVGTYAYSARGSVTSHTGTVATPLQYAGAYTDAETGFLFADARYYDPATNQFTTVDPDVLSSDEAYAYAGNNPINDVDPDGQNWESIVGAIGIVALDGVEEVATDGAATPFLAEEDAALAGAETAESGAEDAVDTDATPDSEPDADCATQAGAVPGKVHDVLSEVDEIGSGPSGYRGGSDFANDGRANGDVLPTADAQGNPVSYREYDVNPYQPGVSRGAERLVTGSDGSAYYTDDHYQTYTQIR